MEQLIVCIVVWALVLLLVPPGRINALRNAAIISVVWMVIIDNLSAYLGFYYYEHIWIPVGSASLFQLLVCAGIGILMINWLNENLSSKLLSIITVAALFSIVQYLYSQTGAFRYGKFDMVVTYIYHLAALIIYVWLSLLAIGEQKVYTGKKTRNISNKTQL